MPPTAATMALSGTRGAHPTMRLDSFLRSTDVGYQHAEAATQGDHFIRKMATYGQVRPSASFTSGARVTRPVKECGAMAMSNLPATWNDPRGDPREGTLEIPAPVIRQDDELMRLYQNHALMMPSERYREHIRMKKLIVEQKDEKEVSAMYKKRMRKLETSYPTGVTGIDGPLFPGTKLYEQRQSQLVAQENAKADKADRRFDTLAQWSRADDAISFKHYASDPGLARSRDICVQRKRVDPVAHPFRFIDTHQRLFPTFEPAWDPERARAIRSHDVRDGTRNILSGVENALSYNVAGKWDDPKPPRSREPLHTHETGITL